MSEIICDNWHLLEDEDKTALAPLPMMAVRIRIELDKEGTPAGGYLGQRHGGIWLRWAEDDEVYDQIEKTYARKKFELAQARKWWRSWRK